MAKRYTDTDKWTKNKWFRKLPIEVKLFWLYILDNCSSIGVWEEDCSLVEMLVGIEIDATKMLEILGDRVKVIKGGKKWLIVDFIRFQYGTLSNESRVHVSYINEIRREGLLDELGHYIVDRSNTIQATRQRLTSKKKSEIIAESNYTCQYCGSADNANLLICDHIVPIVKGGNNEDDNLCAICPTCNSKKSDLDPFVYIETNNIKPLNILSKKLDTLSKKLDRYKEKEKEKEEDKAIKGGTGENLKPYTPTSKVDWLAELEKSEQAITATMIKLRPQNCTETEAKELREMFLADRRAEPDGNKPDVTSYFLNWVGKSGKALLDNIRRNPKRERQFEEKPQTEQKPIEVPKNVMDFFKDL